MVKGKRLSPRAALATAFVVLSLATCAAYNGVVHNKPVWDDAYLTVKNPFMESLSGLCAFLTNDIWTTSALGEKSSFYRPAAMISLWLNRLIGGNTSASYHVANVVLHLLVSLAIYALCRRLLASQRVYSPLICAVSFALCALNSEAVSWISGRFDLVAALAAVLAVLSNRVAGIRGMVVASAAFGCALLSKESSVYLLAVLILSDLIIYERTLKQSLARSLGFALTFAVYVAVRMIIGVPTSSPLQGVGFLELLQSYAFMVATYARLIVVPIGLDAFHPYRLYGIVPSFCVLGFLALVSIALVVAWRGRPTSTRLRVALFGWLWLLLALAPAATTGPHLRIVGDRYAYQPLIGLALCMAAVVDGACERLARESKVWLGRFATLAIVGICVAQGLWSARRVKDWHDDISLFQASLRAHPRNPYAQAQLGAIAAMDGRLAEAEPLLLDAVSQEPRAWRTHDAICFLRINQNRLRDAHESCTKALELNDRNPRAWVNMATVFVRENEWSGALSSADKAIALRPNYVEGSYLRAVSLANLGKLEEAVRELRKTLSLNPEHPGALGLRSQFLRRGLSL